MESWVTLCCAQENYPRLGGRCVQGFLVGFHTCASDTVTSDSSEANGSLMLHKRIIPISVVQVEMVSQLGSLTVLCMIKFPFQNGGMGQPIL